MSTSLPFLPLIIKKLIRSTDSKNRLKQPPFNFKPLSVASVFNVPIDINNHLTHALVDTGADVSVLPRSFLKYSQQSDLTEEIPNLVSASGVPIATFGYHHLRLHLGRCEYSWKFIIADVLSPILGSDFLAHNNLLVDCANQRLIRSGDITLVRGQQTNSQHQNTSIRQIIQPPTLRHLSPRQESEFQTLLQSYKEIFGPLPPPSQVKHPIKHSIQTEGPPVASRPYRLPISHLEPTKSLFADLLEQEVIRPSKSPYASPLVLVAKKDGSTRPCVDYRKLNCQTLPDSYPLPRIEDILSSARGKFFSTIDLKNGYYQIPVAESDIPKTAVTTPFGLFEYMRMPFGLRNAAPTFQRFMDFVLRGLPGVSVYIDDILITSDTFDEHLQRVEKVLRCLKDSGLRVNAGKSIWCQPQINYLGFQITSGGYGPSGERTQALRAASPPRNADQLRRILGMYNFYRLHIPNFAKIAAPLYDRLKDFKWDIIAQEAFVQLQKSLEDTTLLTQPKTNIPFTIHTDASAQAIGGVISQQGQPLAFFSSKLAPSEQRYSTFDKEAFAIFKVIKAFRHWFEGHAIKIFTDHQPLVSFMEMRTPSPRQARWSSYLSEFNISINYVVGKQNVVADHLSRPNSNEPLSNNLNSIQSSYGVLHPWYKSLSKFKPDESIITNSGLVLQQDKNSLWHEHSTGQPRLFIPPDLRKEAFDITHNVSHLGIKKMLRLMCTRFFWPNMRKDIQTWGRCCLICQASKITFHNHHVPCTFHATRRFQTVHVDIVGPLPTSSNGSSYLLTMIDKFSRWVEAVPLQNISAKSCAQAFLMNWVSRFGIPETLVSDQGTQFESALFNELLSFLGITRMRTTAYHPQTNGAIERSHRTIKNALRTICKEASDWELKLPLVLLSLRTSAPEPTKVPPCKLILGTDIRIPIDVFLPPTDMSNSIVRNSSDLLKVIQDAIVESSNMVLKNVPPTSSPAIPPVSDYVWLRDDRPHRSSLATPYQGPYKVLAQNGPVVTIDKDGQEYKVNYDRLKRVVTYKELNEVDVHKPFECCDEQSMIPSSQRLTQSLPTNSEIQVNNDDAPSGHSEEHVEEQISNERQPQDHMPSVSSSAQQPTPSTQSPNSSQFGRTWRYRFGNPKYK